MKSRSFCLLFLAVATLLSAVAPVAAEVSEEVIAVKVAENKLFVTDNKWQRERSFPIAKDAKLTLAGQPINAADISWADHVKLTRGDNDQVLSAHVTHRPAGMEWLTTFLRFGTKWITAPLVIFVAIVLPFLLGWVIARSVQMPAYSWRIGLILCTTIASLITIWLGWEDIRLGVDLKGGWIMIYQIEDPSQQPQPVNVSPRQASDDTSNRGALIQKLKQRLNPDGLREISIRPYGLDQVEIIVPETDRAEVEKLKRQIQEQGVMEFLILAERGQDSALFDAARAQANDPALRRKRSLIDPKTNQEIGRWVRVGREDKEDAQLPGVRPLRIVGGWGEYLIRNPATGEILNSASVPGGRLRGTKYFRDTLHIENVEVLTKLHDRYKVTGGDLRDGGVFSSIDENGRPEVAFSFKPASAANMGGLTQANIGRQLAIVLDDSLLSHATIRSQITDSGRITGNFSQEEVNFIIRILKAGSLPAKLRPDPVYEDPSDPTLGAENIRQGAIAIVVSLALVFLFCLVYYRYAGIVACIALVMNILLTLAVMILFGATLTMPGLAGMVLTVGMAVDSNVLIFERMREELAKGASLRMAIRNGYDRAMVTIIDSNLTTLLTAVILYVIGTDQLVGFAVTLTLGLIISMFTAVFCTRVIFEVSERTGAIRTLKFLQFLTTTNYDFVRYMGICVAASCILIGVGLAAAFYRGGGIFDIDLRGGTSIQVALTKPMGTEEMRTMLDKAFEGLEFEGSKVDYTLKPVGRPEEGDKHDTFRVDSIMPDVTTIQDRLLEYLKEGDQSLIKHYQVEYEPASTAMIPRDESAFFTAFQGDEKSQPAEVGAADRSEPAEKPETAKTDNKSEAGEQADPSSESTEPEQSQVSSTLRFKDSTGQPEPIDRDGVIARVEAAAKAEGFDAVGIVVDHPDWDLDPVTRRSEWNVRLSTTPAEANRILRKVVDVANREPVWPASKKIGGQIAGDFVKIAIGALLASILGIVLYIWFRFQNVTWGFAAVVALVHDVLFMLAGIAVSYWFSGAPAFTGLTEFKIDLTVIAAFLTLIGYSINDTIVIFDRMREIKGKLPTINRDIVNASVNQTLSRSVLTFLTVFMTVAVLYAWGGPGIHAFAYAMLIGTVVGMYSTVFIAAPFLLWMLNRNAPAKKPV